MASPDLNVVFDHFANHLSRRDGDKFYDLLPANHPVLPSEAANVTLQIHLLSIDGADSGRLKARLRFEASWFAGAGKARSPDRKSKLKIPEYSDLSSSGWQQHIFRDNTDSDLGAFRGPPLLAKTVLPDDAKQQDFSDEEQLGISQFFLMNAEKLQDGSVKFKARATLEGNFIPRGEILFWTFMVAGNQLHHRPELSSV
ncbi:hypothetical protein B0H12DRAFT_1077427 [Mycena haematopus]|nr:hypothetical protein B0H12DRAFT_1077427 [Mycena haematopus]